MPDHQKWMTFQGQMVPIHYLYLRIVFQPSRFVSRNIPIFCLTQKNFIEITSYKTPSNTCTNSITNLNLICPTALKFPGGPAGHAAPAYGSIFIHFQWLKVMRTFRKNRPHEESDKKLVTTWGQQLFIVGGTASWLPTDRNMQDGSNVEFTTLNETKLPPPPPKKNYGKWITATNLQLFSGSFQI